MKTAMQELIEDVKSNIHGCAVNLSEAGLSNIEKRHYNAAIITGKDILRKATELLELEKQQIVQAVDRMTNRLIANEIITEAGCTDDSTHGEIYYNQTFNQQS